jgi:hypothetical protein
LAYHAYTCLSPFKIKAFKNKNMFETALVKTAFDYKLSVNDKMVMVYMVWGLEPRNMDKCDRFVWSSVYSAPERTHN